MDIIIKNGKIDTKDMKRIFDIKNEEGLLKKDYNKEFRIDIAGPYYDLFDTHLHVSRKAKDIKNFSGPQYTNKKKLETKLPWNDKQKFCAICHCVIKINKSFDQKQNMFSDFVAPMRAGGTASRKLPLTKVVGPTESVGSASDATIITEAAASGREMMDIEKIKRQKIEKQYNEEKEFENKSLEIYNFLEMNQMLNSLLACNYSKTGGYNPKILSRFYYLVYKLIKKPELYDISPTCTIIRWPWEMTYYQKLKKNCPDYRKLDSIYFQENNKIIKNFVVIE